MRHKSCLQSVISTPWSPIYWYHQHLIQSIIVSHMLYMKWHNSSDVIVVIVVTVLLVILLVSLLSSLSSFFDWAVHYETMTDSSNGSGCCCCTGIVYSSYCYYFLLSGVLFCDQIITLCISFVDSYPLVDIVRTNIICQMIICCSIWKRLSQKVYVE